MPKFKTFFKRIIKYFWVFNGLNMFIYLIGTSFFRVIRRFVCYEHIKLVMSHPVNIVLII